MSSDNKVIKEIVCLKSIQVETGRPRVLKPGDFESGEHWERQVEAALSDPASYEIHRETIYAEEERDEDLSKIELKDMPGMSRERVAEIAEFYGIKDEGQGRAALIDQIAAEKLKEEAVLSRHLTQGQALGDPVGTTGGAGPDNL